MGPQANITASKDTRGTQTDVVSDKIINDCLTEIKSSAEFEDLNYRLHRSCTGEMCLIVTGSSTLGLLGPPLDPINVTVTASGLCYTYVQFLPVEVTDLKTGGCLSAKKFRQVLWKLTGKSHTFCPGFVKAAFPDDFDYEAHGLQLVKNPFFRVQSLRCAVFFEIRRATPRVITQHIDLQLCPSCQRTMSDHCLAEKMKTRDLSMTILAELFPDQNKHEALPLDSPPTVQTSGNQEIDDLETDFEAEENSHNISWTTGFLNQSSEEQLSDSFKNRDLSKKMTRGILPKWKLNRQTGCNLLVGVKECSVQLNRLEAGDKSFLKHKKHTLNSSLLSFHSLPASPSSLRSDSMDEVSTSSTEILSSNLAPRLSPRPVLSARVKPFTINSRSFTDNSSTQCFDSAKSSIVLSTPVSITTDVNNACLSPEAEPPILTLEEDLSPDSPSLPRPINNNFDSGPGAKRQCYRCSSCLGAFSSSLDLKQHVPCHHCTTLLKNGSKSSAAVCTEEPACRALATKGRLALARVTAAEGSKMLSAAERRKIMSCNDCGKQFKKKTVFARHIKKHMQSVQYFCTVCSKLFSRQKSYVDHVAWHRAHRRRRPPLTGREKFVHSICNRAKKRLEEKALLTAVSVPVRDSCASRMLLVDEASALLSSTRSEENTKSVVPFSGWSVPLSCSAEITHLSPSALSLNPSTIMTANAASIDTDVLQSETSLNVLPVKSAAIDAVVTVPSTFTSSAQSASAQVLSTVDSSAASALTLASESNPVTVDASSTQLSGEGRSSPAAHPLNGSSQDEEPSFPFTDCDLNLHLLSSVSLAKAELDGPIVIQVPDKNRPATPGSDDGKTQCDDVPLGPSLEVTGQSVQHSTADSSSGLIAFPSSSAPVLPQSGTDSSLSNRLSDVAMTQSEEEMTLKEREERVHKREEVLKARELAMTRKDLFLQKLMLAYFARQRKVAAAAGNGNYGNKSIREDNDSQNSTTAAPCTLGSVADVPSKPGFPNEQKLLALHAAFNNVMRRVSEPRPSGLGSSSGLGHQFPTREFDKSLSQARHPLLRDSINGQPKLPAAPVHSPALAAGTPFPIPRQPLDSVSAPTACPTGALAGSSTVALPTAGNSQTLQASSSIQHSLMMLQQIKLLESFLPDKVKEFLPQPLPVGCESRSTPVSSLQDNSLCPNSPGLLSSYPGSPLQNSPLSTNSSLTSSSYPNSPLFYAPAASQECSLKRKKSVNDKVKPSDIPKKSARDAQKRKKAGNTRFIEKKESGLAGCFVEEAPNSAVTPLITSSQMNHLLSLLKPASIVGKLPESGKSALSSKTENSTISPPLPSSTASAVVEHRTGSATARDSLPPSLAEPQRYLSSASPSAVSNLPPAVNNSNYSPAGTEIESLRPASFRDSDPNVVTPPVAVYKEIPFQADSCSPLSASEFESASQSESRIVSYKGVATVRSPSPSLAVESNPAVSFAQPLSMRESQLKEGQTQDTSPSKLVLEMSHSDARLSGLNANAHVADTRSRPVTGQPQPNANMPQTQACEILAGMSRHVTLKARLAKHPVPSPSNDVPPFIHSAPYNLSAALSRGRHPHLSPPAATTRSSPLHVAPGACQGPETLPRGRYPHLSPPADTTRSSPLHVAPSGACQGPETLPRGRYPHLSPPAETTRSSPIHVAPPGACQRPETLPRGRYPHLSPPAETTRSSPLHVAPPGACQGPETLPRGRYPHLSPPAETTRSSPLHVAPPGACQGPETLPRGRYPHLSPPTVITRPAPPYVAPPGACQGPETLLRGRYPHLSPPTVITRPSPPYVAPPGACQGTEGSVHATLTAPPPYRLSWHSDDHQPSSKYPIKEAEPMDLTKDSCFGKERSRSDSVGGVDYSLKLRPQTTGQPSHDKSGILRHVLLCPSQMPEQGGSDERRPYRPSSSIYHSSHAPSDRSPPSFLSSPSIRRMGGPNAVALNCQLEAFRQAGFESSNSALKSEGYALMKHFTPELIPESLHQTMPHDLPASQHGGQLPEQITSSSPASMLQGGGRFFFCNNDEKAASKHPQLYISSSGIVSSQGSLSMRRTVSPISPTAATDNPDISLSCTHTRTTIQSPQPAHSGSQHYSAEVGSLPSRSMASPNSGCSVHYTQSKPVPVHEFHSSARGPALASPPPAHGMSRQLSPGSRPADSTCISFSPSPDFQHSKVAAAPASTPVTLPNFLLLPTTSALSRENIPEKMKAAMSEATKNSNKGLECSNPLGGFAWHRPAQDGPYLAGQMRDVGEYSQDRYNNEKGGIRTSAETDEDLEQDRTQWKQQFLQTLRQHREKQQQLKQPEANSAQQSRDHLNPQQQEQETQHVLHRSSQRGRSSSARRRTRGNRRGRGRGSFVTFTASGEVDTMLSSSQEQNNNWNTCMGNDASLYISSSKEGAGNVQMTVLKWRKSRGRPRGRGRGRGRGRPPALLFVPDSAPEQSCSFSAKSSPREPQASLSTKKVENWQVVSQQAPGGLGPSHTLPDHQQLALPPASDMKGFKGESSVVPPLRLKLATSLAEPWHPVASKRMQFRLPPVSKTGKESELTSEEVEGVSIQQTEIGVEPLQGGVRCENCNKTFFCEQDILGHSCLN